MTGRDDQTVLIEATMDTRNAPEHIKRLARWATWSIPCSVVVFIVSSIFVQTPIIFIIASSVLGALFFGLLLIYWRYGAHAIFFFLIALTLPTQGFSIAEWVAGTHYRGIQSQWGAFAQFVAIFIGAASVLIFFLQSRAVAYVARRPQATARDDAS